MTIEYYILAVISTRPCTGYDIKQEFEHPGAGMYWGISFGSIYPKLKKLESEGFIETLHHEETGRGKKVYDLTSKGWRELQKWLKEDPQPPILKDELLIKVSFWNHIMLENREGVIPHLLKRKQETEETLAYYTNWPKNGVSTISEFGMYTIQYVQKKLQAELDWIDETIEAVKGPAKPPAQDPSNLIDKKKERIKKALELEKSDES